MRGELYLGLAGRDWIFFVGAIVVLYFRYLTKIVLVTTMFLVMAEKCLHSSRISQFFTLSIIKG